MSSTKSTLKEAFGTIFDDNGVNYRPVISAAEFNARLSDPNVVQRTILTWEEMKDLIVPSWARILYVDHSDSILIGMQRGIIPTEIAVGVLRSNPKLRYVIDGNHRRTAAIKFKVSLHATIRLYDTEQEMLDAFTIGQNVKNISSNLTYSNYELEYTKPIKALLKADPTGELATRIHCGERSDFGHIPFDKTRYIQYSRVVKWMKSWYLHPSHLSDFSFLYLKYFAPAGSPSELFAPDVQRGLIFFFNLLTYDLSIQIRHRKVGDFLKGIRDNRKLLDDLTGSNTSKETNIVTSFICASWLERFPNAEMKKQFDTFQMRASQKQRATILPNPATLPVEEEDTSEADTEA